jgi:hypothetical protein
MFRPLIELAIIRLKTRKITQKFIQCNMWHTSRLGWVGGGGGTRYRFYNALEWVRLCSGDMEAYAMCNSSWCATSVHHEELHLDIHVRLIRREKIPQAPSHMGRMTHTKNGPANAFFFSLPRPQTSSEDTFYTQVVIPTEDTTTEPANSIGFHVTSTWTHTPQSIVKARSRPPPPSPPSQTWCMSCVALYDFLCYFSCFQPDDGPLN